jgi:Holliday junction resolvase RusA-like endonuclease
VTYKAAKQRQAEENLCALLLPYRPETPLEGPLWLTVLACLPIPGSWSQKKQTDAQQGRIRPTSKPDLDNLVKHMKDCLTDAGFWRDDKQVVWLEAGKLYDQTPGWKVELRVIHP